MRFLILTLVMMTTPFYVHAAATRALSADTIQNTSGGTALSLPSVGSSFISDTATQTLTGKSISGTNNTLTALPAAALTGTVGVANGGTGASSLTSGSLLVGNGTSAVTYVAPGTTGNVLTSSGGAWTSAAAPATAPTVTGSQAAPQSILAANPVPVGGTNYFNVEFIQGASGAVVSTANPQVAAGTSTGQQLILRGTSASNTVTLADGNGLSLNGTWVGSNNSALLLIWDGSVWAEVSRR